MSCKHCGRCPECGQPTPHPFYGQPYFIPTTIPYTVPQPGMWPNTSPIYGGGIGIGGGSINTGEPYGSLMN